MPFDTPCTNTRAVYMDWHRMHSTWHTEPDRLTWSPPQLPMHEQSKRKQLLNTQINASDVGEVEGLIKVDLFDRICISSCRHELQRARALALEQS